jgi:hypothetical protein
MEWAAKLRTEFLKQAHSGGPEPIYDAVVTAIDPETYTCTILLNEISLADVRLRAVVSNNQSIDVLPAIDSAVVVGKMGDDDFLVIACDQITSYRVTVGLMVFTIDQTGFKITNGTDSLAKILTDLVKGVLTIAAPKDVPDITALLLRISNLLT